MPSNIVNRGNYCLQIVYETDFPPSSVSFLLFHILTHIVEKVVVWVFLYVQLAYLLI